MTPNFSYESDLFKSMPENSGQLAIYISESRCDIAICSSSFVLVLLESYVKGVDRELIDFLRDIFSSKQSLFAKHFQGVNVGVHNQLFTLLPNELDVDSNSVIEFLTGSSDAEVFEKQMESLNSQLVFQIPKELKKLIDQSFEKPSLSHVSEISLQLARGVNSTLFLLVGENFFDLVTKKEGQIHSINRFEMESEEDVVYFSLLALKDANIDPQEAKMVVTGYCPPNGQLHQRLLEFISQVEVSKQNETISIRSDYDQPAHYAEAVINLLHAHN